MPDVLRPGFPTMHANFRTRPAAACGVLRSLVSAAWLLTATGFLLTPALAFAQGQTRDWNQLRQALLNTYQTNQTALVQEQQVLLASGATSEQFQAWQQQNAARFAAQQRRAQRISLLSVWEQLPDPGSAVVPAGASPALAAFLQERDGLAAAHVRLHNRRARALPTDATVQEVLQNQQDEAALFDRQQSAALVAQAQQAQVLAQQSAGQLAPLPPPLQIPAGATPQLAAYLTVRDALARAQIQLRNQYVGTDAATRQTVLEQWQQQNAPALQRLQALADALAQTH